ncbi:o-succinylbenzoate--CoA ligase [Deferrisoma palaeochoriense]
MEGIGWWLRKREELSADREAVVDGDRRLTYRDLNRRVNRAARALQALGVKPGDRVGLLAYNRAEFVEVIFATAKLGAILVPLNWRLTAPELDYILTDSGTETLLFDPGLEDLARELRAAACVRGAVCLGADAVLGAHAYEACLAAQPDAEPEVSPLPDGDTPHILMYTSGTTGRPKGAVLSQGASFWNALNLQLALDFTSADRNLLALPMFHIGGIGLFTLPMLYVGGTVVLQRTFDASETLRLLREERISLFFGVPAMFLFLLQHPEFDPSAFAGVRCAMSGGAPLPPSLVQQYHEAGIALQQGFGMSEAAPGITTLPKNLALLKAGSVGRALFHVEVRVVDERGDEVPRGQVGELVLRGPNLMQGYWNRPEATRQAFSGGWFHSGDLARMDEDGDLYIVDRKKDMFISGGENVYPAEVENLIYELPQVSEAAVVGVPDDTWGEVGCAVVAVKHGHTLTVQQVLEHLRPRLAKYKVPKRVVFVDALPRNAAGKVLKNVLREQAR